MWGVELVVMAAMIAVNSVFAGYEIALASVSVGRLKRLAEEKRHGAEVALYMKQNVEASLAVVQFWPELTPLLKVVGVLVAGISIDAAFLSPRFVGGKIGLHPVWLIFALFVFSYLFGLVGTLVAVPLAAAIGVLARFAVHVYLGSSVYKGATAQGGMPVSPGGAP